MIEPLFETQAGAELLHIIQRFSNLKFTHQPHCFHLQFYKKNNDIVRECIFLGHSASRLD